MDYAIIAKYFPDLSPLQKEQFEQLGALYADWNAKINVVSRKDIDNLYERHVLHALALAKYENFADGSRILDVGTGGGFPGIPLAILFPKCRFVLIDSIAKKVRVAQAVADAIGLKNVEIIQRNAKEEKRTFDYVVSRAVMAAPDLLKLIRKNLANGASHGMLLCLKGGDLTTELAGLEKRYTKIDVQEIRQWFSEDFFETKKVLSITL